MTLKEEKLWQILKYGNYLPRRQDIDLDSLHEDERHVSSMLHPNGVYANLGEQIETEFNIRFEDWCEMYGYDIELSVYAPVMKE
jgi:hypothetical protein